MRPPPDKIFIIIISYFLLHAGCPIPTASLRLPKNLARHNLLGTTKHSGSSKSFVVRFPRFLLLPSTYCVMQLVQGDSGNQEDDEILNLTKYILDKVKMVQPKTKDFKEELLMFARSIFFDHEMEIEKNVIYHSGFQGEHGEEIPIKHKIKYLSIADKLRVCDAIIGDSFQGLWDSDKMYKAIAKTYPSSRCSNAWEGDHMAYRCRTCGLSDSSCMCVECFDPEEHKGHDFRLYSSPSGGCCDCGDPLAWSPSGFCKRHQVPDDYHDPSSSLEESTRLRVEAIVYNAIEYLLDRAQSNLHADNVTAERAAEYQQFLNSELYREFEHLYITTTVWLKKLAGRCDAFRHIVCEFYLGVRRPCCEINEILNSFSLTTEEYLEKVEHPPLKLFFQISRKLREEPQTQFAMLHLGLLFSSKFKEKYTAHFCTEYSEYIRLLAAYPQDSVCKGVSGFLDRVFCQLFHSPDQVLKLTKTTNLVSSLVDIFTKILRGCLTLNCRSVTGNITHVQSGIPPFCLDAESSILSQERHCRSRILVDLKTLVGHSIVSEVTVFGLMNKEQASAGQENYVVSTPRLYMEMLDMFATVQAMNSQGRETAAHIPYENKAFKVAFLLELELLFISSA